MSEFRRGIKSGVWQTRWHSHPQCPDYPTRNFAIAVFKPSDEQICPHCASLPQCERRALCSLGEAPEVNGRAGRLRPPGE